MSKMSIKEAFELIVDPRVNRRRQHNLIDIIVLAICGTVSGCQGWVEIVDFAETREEWFRKFLELPNGIPSHDTMGRVFSILDPQAFQDAFFNWLNGIRDILVSQQICIDGKFLKGALRETRRPRSAIQLVSAWSTEFGICIAQKKSILEKEEGEKRIMEQLIKTLHLKGCIVSIDANGATERITNSIVEQNGDYLIGLKNNQMGMLKYAEVAFDSVLPISKFETTEKEHGRIDERKYELVKVHGECMPGMIQCWQRYIQKFKDLKAFVRVQTTRTIGSESKTETRYYFTSLIDVRTGAKAIRDHWAIENKLHRTLDVNFGEDHSQIRAGHAAENLGLIRRMAINMLKQETSSKKSIRRKQMACMSMPDYLEKVLGANLKTASEF